MACLLHWQNSPSVSTMYDQSESFCRHIPVFQGLSWGNADFLTDVEICQHFSILSVIAYCCLSFLL